MTNQDYTHIAVVADRSGSMYGIADDMNGGLEKLLKEQATLPGTLTVDVTTFDSFVEFPYTSASVSEIKFPIIDPRGSTALLDALGKTITSLGERLAKLKEEERPGKVLILVVTDGEENASREWTNDGVRKLVKQQQDDYGWEFMFLGANIDSFAVGGGFGIRKGATLNYEATSAGVTRGMATASAYMSTYRTLGDADFTEVTSTNQSA